MGVLKRVGQILCIIMLGLVLYWTYAVLQARSMTPTLLEAVKQRQDLQIEAIPGPWIDSLITVEDPSFWTNDGIDFSTPGQGLTTLTQALAKRLYFDRYTPGFEKIELILFARFALNAQAPKEEILNAFLTVAYLGEDDLGPIIGFPDAARRWYGVELSELTEKQFLGLAAMLIAPNSLNPARNSKGLRDRVTRIERLVKGSCAPSGLMDVALDGCRSP